MSKFIGFSGKKGSGKNTAADMLSDYLASNKLSSYHVSFAHTLKSTCINLFGLNPELVFGDDNDKNTLTNVMWDNLPLEIRNKYSRSGSMTVREVLQVVGTDIFRNMFDNDIWVKAAFNGLPDCDYIIFTDVRFPNEANAIKAKNGKVIRINRPSNAVDVHISETALDNYEFDLIISNTGTLLDLERSIKDII